MHQFDREVERFLATTIPQLHISRHPGNKGIMQVKAASGHVDVLIVFHFLNESPEVHMRNISGFISSKDKKVVHLWQDQWEFDTEKIQSRLISLFNKTTRIHGRETTIKDINNELLLAFLGKNHLNVPIKAKYKYGLYKGDQLMAVMSFSKGRLIERNDIPFNSYELLRFCNKLNYTVVGGFSKLLNHFIKNVSPDDIMTYVDKDWSDGSVYEKAGFVLEGQLSPMMFFLNQQTGQRIYPEHEHQDSGKIQVYNSGSYKYIRYLKKA